MNTIDIEKITTQEQLRTMEALWDARTRHMNLSRRFGTMRFCKLGGKKLHPVRQPSFLWPN